MAATITKPTIKEKEAAPPSLWQNHDFWRLWGGQVVSSIGGQVSQLALPLLILALTHSPAQAGLLAALRGVPYLLLVLPAGALIDRWNPRRVMIFCDTGRALALGSHSAGACARPFGAVAVVFGDVCRRHAVRVLQSGRIELPGARRLQRTVRGGGRAERGGIMVSPA